MDRKRRFPVDPNAYRLYEAVGDGATATVHRALCVPLNEIVAIKVMDLKKCKNDLEGVSREVQTMSLINHPNLLGAYCSFTAGHCVWVVMPYMAAGSCLHIMKSAHPYGFEEPIIATLLKEILKALVYLHGLGLIHTDVKAGNILVDVNGAVKLADFGVSSCMFDNGDRQRLQNTFVGTPCWMAPEVMRGPHGYDFKADIWSFGITALELAQGHAPFSGHPLSKVMLMTLRNAPPGLDYERDKIFSKSFKELVATCLVKDPFNRPSAEKLLKHSFFKHARSAKYLVRTILDGLSPLGDQFRILKGKEADFLPQNKPSSGNKDKLSQQEYIQGISAWNFNLEDLKVQAALIQSSDSVLNSKEFDNNHKVNDSCCIVDSSTQNHSLERVKQASTATPAEDGFNDLQDLEGPASAFRTCPLQALKSCFDVCEDDTNGTASYLKDSGESTSGSIFPPQKSTDAADLDSRKYNGDIMERSLSVPVNIHVLGCRKFSSGSLLPEHILSPYKPIAGDAERYQQERNSSGPLLCHQKRSSHNSTSALCKASVHEEPSEGRVVQQRGRFKITSTDASRKIAPTANCMVNPISGVPSSPVNAASVLPLLQNILQQNAMQGGELINLIKHVEQTYEYQTDFSNVLLSDLQQLTPASNKERELQTCIGQLQHSIGILADEMQRLKSKNTQIEQQINALSTKERKEESKEVRER